MDWFLYNIGLRREELMPMISKHLSLDHLFPATADTWWLKLALLLVVVLLFQYG